MPYISGGQVLDSQQRSIWRLSTITDFFWGVANFVFMFVQTMINPNYNSKGSRYTTDYRVTGNGGGSGGGGGGGGGGPPRMGPQRRIGGFGRGGAGGPACPPMAGGG